MDSDNLIIACNKLSGGGSVPACTSPASCAGQFQPLARKVFCGVFSIKELGSLPPTQSAYVIYILFTWINVRIITYIHINIYVHGGAHEWITIHTQHINTYIHYIYIYISFNTVVNYSALVVAGKEY